METTPNTKDFCCWWDGAVCNLENSIFEFIFMMKSSNGNIFRVTGPLCGELTGGSEFPPTKASDAEIWYIFDLPLYKRLSKQSEHRRFETPSHPLWRHCNVVIGQAGGFRNMCIPRRLQDPTPLNKNDGLRATRFQHCNTFRNILTPKLSNIFKVLKWITPVYLQ